MNGRKLHHYVYVIELNSAVLNERRFLQENPNININLTCYYVGRTGLTPEERFKNHKSGIKSSRIVKKYGMHLVPELYENYNPTTYDLASAVEILLAEMLRGKGHGIWQK